MFSLLYHGESFLLLRLLFLLFLTFTPAIVLMGFVYGLTKLITEMKIAKTLNLSAGNKRRLLNKRRLTSY